MDKMSEEEELFISFKKIMEESGLADINTPAEYFESIRRNSTIDSRINIPYDPHFGVRFY